MEFHFVCIDKLDLYVRFRIIIHPQPDIQNALFIIFMLFAQIGIKNLCILNVFLSDF